MSSVFDDIASSTDPALTLCKSPTKKIFVVPTEEILVVATEKAIFVEPAGPSEHAIASMITYARTLLASLDDGDHPMSH
jgi:hypothetical protein